MKTMVDILECDRPISTPTQPPQKIRITGGSKAQPVRIVPHHRWFVSDERHRVSVETSQGASIMEFYLYLPQPTSTAATPNPSRHSTPPQPPHAEWSLLMRVA